MPHTDFDPKEYGFAFNNSWNFDAAEEKDLYETFAGYLNRGTIAGTLMFGPLGSFSIAMGILALRRQMKVHLTSTSTFGLCGGMSFAALDYHKAGRQPSKMPHPPDPGTELHHYIWQRQRDSLIHDGAKFLAWVLALKYPHLLLSLRGPAWVQDQSEKEWGKLTRSVNQGEPIPIGLVRDTNNVFDDHQVLAIGYEGTFAHGEIFLYDPNCSGRKLAIHIGIKEGTFVGDEDCQSSPAAKLGLRGFFCEHYRPSDPP